MTISPLFILLPVLLPAGVVISGRDRGNDLKAGETERGSGKWLSVSRTGTSDGVRSRLDRIPLEAATRKANIFHDSPSSGGLSDREEETDLRSLARGSLSGDGGPPIPLPAPRRREDARALDMYAAGAGGGLHGGQQTGLLPPGVERV